MMVRSLYALGMSRNSSIEHTVVRVFLKENEVLTKRFAVEQTRIVSIIFTTINFFYLQILKEYFSGLHSLEIPILPLKIRTPKVQQTSRDKVIVILYSVQGYLFLSGGECPLCRIRRHLSFSLSVCLYEIKRKFV